MSTSTAQASSLPMADQKSSLGQRALIIGLIALAVTVVGYFL